jgi:hypothetical protein
VYAIRSTAYSRVTRLNTQTCMRSTFLAQPMPEHRLFGSPFNESDSDITLRSSNVVFMAQKSILCVASPFFRTMFSLPQAPAAVQDASELVGGLVCVRMSEDSGTLSRLLSFIYPTPILLPETFKEAALLLSAFHKFEFDSRLPLLKRLLRKKTSCSITTNNAIEAFFVFYPLGFKEDVFAAARLTLQKELKFSMLTGIEDTARGSTLSVLYRYRLACKHAIFVYLSQTRDGITPPGSNSHAYAKSLRELTADSSSVTTKAIPSWLLSHLSECIARFKGAPTLPIKIEDILADYKFLKTVVQIILRDGQNTHTIIFGLA